jgi:hypothetical protein
MDTVTLIISVDTDPAWLSTFKSFGKRLSGASPAPSKTADELVKTRVVSAVGSTEDAIVSKVRRQSLERDFAR